MTLYEIDSAMLECVDAETGEIIDMDKLDALEMERALKIENVACWVKDLTAEAKAIKEEKQELAKRQQVAERKAESLKNWLAYALNGGKFSSPKASVSFRHTKSVEVTDINALVDYDDSLVKYAEPTPDKAAIKQRLNDGENVAGCQLKENTSVIIK